MSMNPTENSEHPVLACPDAAPVEVSASSHVFESHVLESSQAEPISSPPPAPSIPPTPPSALSLSPAPLSFTIHSSVSSSPPAPASLEAFPQAQDSSPTPASLAPFPQAQGSSQDSLPTPEPAPSSSSSVSVGTGRFAPSPTGDLHLGNLRTAILSWVWARRTGRAFVLRLEDIDRVRSGSAERQIADLQAIGIDWDSEILVQSTRYEAHSAALDDLAARGLLFECYCSRKDIREAASAPHVPSGHYPGTCLHLSADERAAKRAKLAAAHRLPALRLRAPANHWTVFDELHGEYTGPVDHFVVRRSDGVPAYNLAAVVDDGFQGVDQVVRGDDLLSQAPAQAALATLLGIPVPVYVHVPLALAPSGARLAKRDGAVTLEDLAALGWSHADVLGWIGRSLGVSGARTAADLLDALDIDRLHAMPLEPWVVTPPTAGPEHRLRIRERLRGGYPAQGRT